MHSWQIVPLQHGSFGLQTRHAAAPGVFTLALCLSFIDFRSSRVLPLGAKSMIAPFPRVRVASTSGFEG